MIYTNKMENYLNLFEHIPEDEHNHISNKIWEALDRAGIELSQDAELSIWFNFRSRGFRLMKTIKLTDEQFETLFEFVDQKVESIVEKSIDYLDNGLYYKVRLLPLRFLLR